jgi:cAMP phosphodiesterase
MKILLRFQPPLFYKNTGYFISHAHLDHVSGLIINSPADVAKTVYAAAKCMDMMENHYFNGEPGLILVKAEAINQNAVFQT